MKPQLNSRLQNVVKRRSDHFEWLAHRSVKFHFTNEFSEGLAVKRINGLLEKIDRIHGGPVPDRTLIRGFPNRPDDIPLRDKIATQSQKPAGEENPHLLALKAHDERNAPPKSQRDEILEQAAAWEAKRKAEQEQAEREASPAWRARHAAAGESYLVAYYTGVPESEYQLAEARLLAVNDPAQFETLDAEYKSRVEKRLAEHDEKIKSELARLQSERDSLNLSTEAKEPSTEAWQLARNDADRLKRDGKSWYPRAADEIDTLHAGVHDGSIQPCEFHQRVEMIREMNRATG